MIPSEQRKRIPAGFTTGPCLILLLTGTAAPSRASCDALLIPTAMECQVRSHLAEAAGDRLGAITWAESLTAIEPGSSYALSRLAALNEDQGEDGAALLWGERALARDSSNAQAAMLVGRMRLRSGEPAVAAQVLTPPLRHLGAMPELYALRALAHQLNRNYEAALADLQRTDVLLPDFAWIATGILGMALEDGRLAEAGSAFRLALDLKPGDSRTLTLGASLARRRGDAFLEETLLRELALGPEARPEDAAAYGAFLVRVGKEREMKMLLGWAEARGLSREDIQVEAGDLLLGAREYRAALAAVRPLRRDPRAISVRARAHLALGNERRALDDYRKLIPRWSLTREESLVVAYLDIRVGSRARGVETLEEVRSAPLETPRQVLAASLCYSLLGNPEEALRLIRESVARGIANSSIYQELGSAAAVLRDSLLAQWAWERFRDSGRETSECLYFLASAELAKGRLPRVVQLLTRAIELNPKNGKALLLLGTLRHRNGQLEMARETLIQAAQCPETVREANRALARVCRRLRLDTEAREAETRARARRPSPSPGLSLFPDR